MNGSFAITHEYSQWTASKAEASLNISCQPIEELFIISLSVSVHRHTLTTECMPIADAKPKPVSHTFTIYHLKMEN